MAETYTTLLTTKSRIQITQLRHYAGDAVDFQIQPVGGADNDIRALFAGTVVHAGEGEHSSYGISVTVLGEGGVLFMRAAHLSRVAVSAGQGVQAGELLGYEGNTGVSTAQHLHLELYSNGTPVPDAQYIDLIGFPITPLYAYYDLTFGGDPDPPEPETSRRRRKIYCIRRR